MKIQALLIPMTAILLMGCEFKKANVPVDEGRLKTSSLPRKDVTLEWQDSEGIRSVTRSLELNGTELSKSEVVPMGTIPELLVLKNFDGGDGPCAAKAWVGQKQLVLLDCAFNSETKQFELRGLDRAIQKGVDRLHTLRIEGIKQNVTLVVRTLPFELPFSITTRGQDIRTLGASTNYHKIAAFEIPAGNVGSITVEIPTTVRASLRRPFIRYGYNFDHVMCEFGPYSAQEDVLKEVDVLFVPDSENLTIDWPAVFSLKTQQVHILKDSTARVIAYVADPLLDLVYGSAPYKEVSRQFEDEEWCQGDPGAGYVRYPVRKAYSDGLLRYSPPRRATIRGTIGRDESDPILNFFAPRFTVYDDASFAIDKNPTFSFIPSRRLDLTLSKDTP